MSQKNLNRSRFGAAPWIGPAIFMIILMVVWPAIEMVRTSFHEIDQTGIARGWNGLTNYRSLLQNPDFPQTILRTAIWVIGVVGITILVSLPIAQLLHQKFPGRRIVRYMLIVPWAASVVMTSIVWRWILDGYYGMLNRILQDFHIIKEPIDWLGNPNIAFAWLMFVAVFVSIPFTTYVILAGLTTISEDILEASTVDGASASDRYREITFPLLRPSLLVAAVINLINVFNSFPIIWAMTQGGPGYSTDTTTTLAYKISFRDQDIGQSASLASINFIVVLIMIVVFLKVSKWNAKEE